MRDQTRQGHCRHAWNQSFVLQPSEEESVQNEDLLNQQIANKPGEYQSQWEQQLKDTLDKIMNRPDFSYDPNGDALYQQYQSNKQFP